MSKEEMRWTTSSSSLKLLSRRPASPIANGGKELYSGVDLDVLAIAQACRLLRDWIPARFTRNTLAVVLSSWPSDKTSCSVNTLLQPILHARCRMYTHIIPNQGGEGQKYHIIDHRKMIGQTHQRLIVDRALATTEQVQ